MTIPFTEKCLVCEISHPTEDEFIQCVEKNIKIVDWSYISQFQTLSETFIERFQDKVNWWWISRYQRLSEQFIEKFQDKVDWIWISRYQQLSESFIQKFQDEVGWWWISGFQQLSETFIEKVLMKLNDPTSQCETYIEKYITSINNRIEIAIERNDHQQQYKKHILSILQEDKINLTEEFKNELLMIILKET
jgi:adenosine deaminase